MQNALEIFIFQWSDFAVFTAIIAKEETGKTKTKKEIKEEKEGKEKNLWIQIWNSVPEVKSRLEWFWGKIQVIQRKTSDEKERKFNEKGLGKS